MFIIRNQNDKYVLMMTVNNIFPHTIWLMVIYSTVNENTYEAKSTAIQVVIYQCCGVGDTVVASFW
jgi:hypothetical protein